MKKIIKIIVPLILMLVCVTGAFAQGTLSEEILNQAKREAGLFLELKSALGLDWLDEYNAYLENPTDNPEPSWDLSVADLVSGGYLSDSFPSDFMITKSGQEVKISRIITSQAMKDVLPIYLPSVTIAGDVVSLIVQRPEQWVAWQAGLLGKVSRDGSDNPDILPNAVLDFGKGSEIRFINDDGKLTGIESLIYKTQELDDRFVNAGGDNMTGDLTINDKKVLTTGDYGHRDDDSGINADMLDGEHGSYYQDASNINKGKLDPARLSGTYNISILGNAATATNANYASRAGDADTLDKKPLSYFAPAGHTHAYVSKTGDTMIGPLGVNFENGISSGIGSHSIRGTGPADVVGKGFKIDWDTDFGFVGLVDKGADRKDMVFANEQTGDNFVFMSQGIEIMALKPGSKTLEIDNKKVLTTGDYGHRSDGSGINADMVDGKHASSFVELDRFGATSTGGTLDWNHVSNTRPGTGYTLLMGNAPNGPGPAVYFHAFNLEYASKDGTGNVTQFAIPYGNSSAINAGIYYRGRYNGTWTAWKKLGGNAIVEQKLSDRGYVQFSNGFIINWGTVGGGGAYAYFAKPFPHRCFIVVTGQFSRSNIWWDPGHATAAVNVTNSSFRNTGPDSAAYVAFGY